MAQSLRGPDFDDDGAQDVAIGAPNDGPGGVVYIYAGVHSFALSQDTAGVPGVSESGDAFGHSVAWGRFNGDEYDDLVVGIPGEDDAIGAIEVFLGGPTGIIPNSGQLIMRTTPNVTGFGVPEEMFGWAIAAGHIPNMGVNDAIVVGAPGDGEFEGGSVQVFPSGTNGIDLSLVSITIADGLLNPGDRFGESVAIGLFDCDERGVAVGSRDRTVSGATQAGSVFVSPPSVGWIQEDIGQWTQITQASSGMTGSPELGDGFGTSLAVGDFNDDGCHDLAVGSPFETIGANKVAAGMVHVIPGAEDGLDTDASVGLYQDVGSVAGNSETADKFGHSLAAALVTSDDAHELVVGVPGEDTNVGFIHIFRGTTSGIQQGNDVLWSQNSPSIPGASESGDGFGLAVAGGSGYVVVGAPFEDINLNNTTYDGAGTTAYLVFQDTPDILLWEAWAIEGSTFNGPRNAAFFGYSIAPGQIR